MLSAIAEVWKERGDVSRAIDLARQALAITERLANPEDRASFHASLSIYLHKVRQIEEGACHSLALMVYVVVTNNQWVFTEYLHEPDSPLNQAAQTDTPYTLPRLNELLQRSDFSALRRWLEEREVNLDELQGKIDKLVKQVEADIKSADEKKPKKPLIS